jgi:hypothetical protein
MKRTIEIAKESFLASVIFYLCLYAFTRLMTIGVKL